MHNNETHSPEFESYEEAQAKVLECLPSYYQNANILNEKKYLPSRAVRTSSPVPPGQQRGRHRIRAGRN